MQLDQNNINSNQGEFIDGVDISEFPPEIQERIRAKASQALNFKKIKPTKRGKYDRIVGMDEKPDGYVKDWWESVVLHTSPDGHKDKWSDHLKKCKRQYEVRLKTVSSERLHLYSGIEIQEFIPNQEITEYVFITE